MDISHLDILQSLADMILEEIEGIVRTEVNNDKIYLYGKHGYDDEYITLYKYVATISLRDNNIKFTIHNTSHNIVKDINDPDSIDEIFYKIKEKLDQNMLNTVM